MGFGDDINSLICHEGYYGVLGNINGEDFEIDKFGVKISFAKDVSFPHDREGEYFWICLSGDFPYVLDEEREIFKKYNFGESFSPIKEKASFIKSLKLFFMKK